MREELELRASLQEMESKLSVPSKHVRSKSDSMKRMKEEMLVPCSESFRHLKLDVGKATGNPDSDAKRKPGPVTVDRSSLKQEILQLERRLKDQMEVRGALEKALGYRPVCSEVPNDNSMPKPTKELIREIAGLELEVMYLEQYLLTLYRKAFDQQVSTLSPTTPKEKSERPISPPRRRLFEEDPRVDASFERTNSGVRSGPKSRHPKPTVKPANEFGSDNRIGPGVHRCQSELSHRAVYSSRISPSDDSLARALQTCHSQPLNFVEDGHCSTSGVISLAEYLGTNISDHVPETPNRISEDMVRCMGAVYCKLADPPLLQSCCLPSSPTSSFSSMSAHSSQYLGDVWSPGCRKESTLDSRLINPFRVEGIKEFSGPYNAMVEVPSICTDAQKLSEVEDLLHSYKSLVGRLETIDPRKMKNEEKLAFWINLHNAMLMHAQLVYGIPQKNTKKASLLVRAVCIIGGRSISAYTIQCYILGCRTHCPGQWLQSLLSPKMRLKAGGEEWRAHAIERSEPLLHFALCSGSHSDPAVRVFSSKRVLQQLQAAKEEYIRATVGIKKEEKILMPKVIGSYAKDVNLNNQGVLDMIKQHLPETLRMALQRCQQGKSHNRVIEWVPYNFTFRYLLSRDLANSQIF